MNNQTKRITKDGYIRPKYTIQDKLTEEEIKDKLEDYVEIEDIFKVPIGTHIRYFTLAPDKNNSGKLKKVFRLGGQLKNKDNCDKYIILSNGSITWTVQMDTSTLYKKMTIDEIKDEYDNIIKDLQEENISLKKDNKILYKKISTNNNDNIIKNLEEQILLLKKDNKKLYKRIMEFEKKI